MADVTDNSPEYPENIRQLLELFDRHFFESHTKKNVVGIWRDEWAELREYIRAAAALARENAELRATNGLLAERDEAFERQWENMCEVELPKYAQRAESAESANRALQAEVDRLTRELSAAQPSASEPVAWRYRLDYGKEGGFTDRVELTRWNPWGEPGVDYSATFTVIETPLYTAPQPSPQQAGTRKVTDEDVMRALRAAEPTRDWNSADGSFPSLAWQMSRMRAALESFAAKRAQD